jgi:hypothetical protein
MSDPSLVDRRSIIKAHRHHCLLIEAKGCQYSSEMDILHPCLKKVISHVNHAEVRTLCTIIQNVVNSWQRVRVDDCVCIELLIVVNPAR